MLHSCFNYTYIYEEIILRCYLYGLNYEDFMDNFGKLHASRLFASNVTNLGSWGGKGKAGFKVY